ncbi:MAG: bifunctional [glutamine synthetase] adenylyltransferase/[glutamine synthetase]-adenylyl-L-tyrosine phosphorylase [Pseudomonadota bacterium]
MALSPRPLADTLDGVVERAAALSPYLRAVIARHGGDVDWTSVGALESQVALEAAKLNPGHRRPLDLDALAPLLRQAKQRVHLILALLDLSCAWDHAKVTHALTVFADACVGAGLNSALAARGLSGDGLVVLAFGKMGAFELNYSSDIDVTVFFDPEQFEGGPKGPQDGAVRVVQDLCGLLERQTEDGYVFRTDLRLRPDPSATPIAVSTARAQRYYESVGQNWERMAWIKARFCAGDAAASAHFMKNMTPFVWRRHMDYWAIDDVHAIKRMINAKVGDPDMDTVDCDVKLGAGGIREIEFFVQTQQVIHGGRRPALRVPATLDALSALSRAGCIDSGEAGELARAYGGLRALEHRIQMLDDNHTHSVPSDPDARHRLALLMGLDGADKLRQELLDTRRSVHRLYSGLFEQDADHAAGPVPGNLVFTGVDKDPGTVRTLGQMGFTAPSRVISAIQRWHRGQVPATRSAQGRALLTKMTPRLLLALSSTGDGDTAFENFERFFDGLRAGVQLLSMLDAEENILEDLVSTLAAAPKLAAVLSREPSLLESLIAGQLHTDFEATTDASFEARMGEARRFHRDQSFLIGHALLNGVLSPAEAAAAFTGLANTMVCAMAEAASAETERKFGAAPGVWCLLGLGSFGGRELTAVSDLDLILVYEPNDEAAAGPWFTRLTQRLITALSAPTEEGALYEVDMRLRPSGRAGPVAVRYSAFEAYHFGPAWTWEHMALTRMAPVAGDHELGLRCREAACRAIDQRKARPTLAGEIDDMRARLRQERRPWGGWDTKRSEGGLVDIEFLVQKRLLQLGGRNAITPHTHDALGRLGEAGAAASDTIECLQSAWRFQSAARQLLQLALDAPVRSDAWPDLLKARLCAALGAPTFEDLCRARDEHYEAVVAARQVFT